MLLFQSPHRLKCLFGLLTILWFQSGCAQYRIEKTASPTDLVKELMGSGVESISNVTVNGVPDDGTVKFGTGIFSEPSGRLNGIKNGAIISTLPVFYTAFHPDSSKYIRHTVEKGKPNHSYFDEDLAEIVKTTSSNNRMYDGTILEFDFVPKGSSFEFSYCFASDEYDKFVCSRFNDAFGFFLSGPGINGPFSNRGINLALIPGTETPVSINTVNNGKPGDFKPDIEKYCDNGEGLKNGKYYRSNNTEPHILDDVIFNGFTTKLTAKAKVICGEKYHIKVAITDIGDHLWNSGVFIESGSFRSFEDEIIQANVDLVKPGCAPYIVSTDNKTEVSKHFWSWGDGSVSYDKKPTHKYNEPGKYKITYIADNNDGCTKADTAFFEVHVEEAKKVEVSIHYVQPEKCFEADTLTVNLKFTGSKSDSLVWNLGDGNVVVNKNYFQHQYRKAGAYNIAMKSFDFACNTDSTIKLNVDYSKPEELRAIAAIESNFLSCDNLILKTRNLSKDLNGTKHYWDFGDGNKSNEAQPFHQYAVSGIYRITYVVENQNFCHPYDTVNFTVEVKNTKPLSANLKFTPPPPCISHNNSLMVSPVFFGESADSLIWNFGDGTPEIVQENVFEKIKKTHTYQVPGNYKFTLRAFDNQCNKDTTISVNIIHQPLPISNIVNVPNIVTPNGDGINDLINLLNENNLNEDIFENLSFCEINIFDRWGQLRFSNNLKGLIKKGGYTGWDFGFNEPDGVYFYYVKYRTVCGELNEQDFFTIAGHITINH